MKHHQPTRSPPVKKRKPLPLMEEFRALVKAKGFTAEGLRDLLNATYLSDNPVSVGAVFNWMKGYNNPRSEIIYQLELFVRSHSESSKRNQSGKSNSKRK